MNYAMVLFMFLFGSPAAADFSGGIVVDSSSNMLLSPGGESGTYTIVYGQYGRKLTERLYMSYDLNGGLLEKYEGIQYYNHEFSAIVDLISKESFALSTKIDADITRFGEVTVLSGYNSAGMQAQMKYYYNPTVLLRWNVSFGGRSYRDYIIENYYEAESYFRIDKFLQTRTTVRLQVEAGARLYHELNDNPVSNLTGIRTRIAQSIFDNLGVSMEINANKLLSSSAENNSNLYYDSVFLDDRYKYENRGVALQIKYLDPEYGSVQLKTSLFRRDYSAGCIEAFDYLPQDGWRETEKGVTLTFSGSFKIFPDFLKPSWDLYYIKVDATESYLSYDAAGMTARLSY